MVIKNIKSVIMRTFDTYDQSFDQVMKDRTDLTKRIVDLIDYVERNQPALLVNVGSMRDYAIQSVNHSSWEPKQTRE